MKRKTKQKVARIILVALVAVIAIVLLFGCSSSSRTSTKAEASNTSLYELYVLDGDSPHTFILYNNYKIKDDYLYRDYGTVRATYYATDGTKIIIASNGVTIVSPKGYIESFTQGYMRRIGDSVWNKRKIVHEQ